MDNKEILLDLIEDYSGCLHYVLADLPPEALYWRPDPQANHIALTVWHVSRAWDLLKVLVLEGCPPEDELWFTRGWAEKTGYNPLGLGFAGFGNLAGYSLEEAAAVPELPPTDLLAYFDQACEALTTCLSAGLPDLLDRPVLFPDQDEAYPAYFFIRNFLMDAREHLGEIKAIKAMWLRRRAAGA